MIQYFFPTHCCLCNQQIPVKACLCQHCEARLTRHQPMQFVAQGILCHTLFVYEDPVAQMLKNLKFTKQLAYARALGMLLGNHLKQHYQQLPDLILPVPLHIKRLRERGFNQSIEIARYIAKILKIQIDKTSLLRHKATQPQAQCSAALRKRNLKNAFSLKKIPKGSRIILLDDVITTGSTMRACYQLLLGAGVGQIDVWSVARTR